MTDVLDRLRVIRDGLAAGCTTDELICDVEVLISLVELAASPASG